MSRISLSALAQAITEVRVMDMQQKEQLADEIFRVQPHMLASVLVQKRMGVSLEKMDFLFNLLFICFQAMKESGLTWPLITEDEQDRQLGRFVGSVKFGDDLGVSLRDQVMRQYVENHPEKELLTYVVAEAVIWLKRIVPEESDKYVMLAAANLVNCIAFVPLDARKI
jgi:hypothetical protein